MRSSPGRAAFVGRLALREGRSALRRVGVFMASISLGVGALVTIHSFRGDVERTVEEEAEELLGADIRLRANRAFPDSVTRIADSLAALGARTATVTTAVSMALAPRTESVRLLQIRGIEGPYPFYGDVTTTPEGVWERGPSPGEALVDPAVLVQLGIEVGDTLLIGEGRFAVKGTVDDLPTELGFQTAVGPRVHLSGAAFRRAALLGFGSLARYQLFLEVPEASDQRALASRYQDVFRATQVRFDTAAEEARELTEATDHLARYLGLVGLGALLLGGIGVASAVHVFVEERLGTVAILRCLGARQRDVFLVYLLQAGALGVLGSLAGALLGVGAQRVLPRLLADYLPVDVTPRLDPVAIGAGVAVGLLVSLLFALGPLLTIRDVPPLRALRRGFEAPKRRFDPARVATYGAVVVAATLLAVLEAPEPHEGLAFAAGLAAVAVVLWATAMALTRGMRRFFPRGASFAVRQGIANLFRPHNQTVSVTLVLGFGAFIVGTVLQVQSSLSRELAFDVAEGRPNLVLFDVQPDQTTGLLTLLPPPARESASVTPVVPARVSSVNGRSFEELVSDTTSRRPDRWALRREYRHTYRRVLSDSEELVAGRWFDELPPFEVGGAARISLEADIAESLRISVGDSIVWNVGGVLVPSVVTSLRFVDWQRFTTNFFVVFEPGVLEDASRMDVVLASLPDDEARARLQRDIVTSFPNVSALDVARVQEALDSILGQVTGAIRFLALACTVAGLLVLAGALATSRHQRTREVALLKTLGARRRVVLGVLATEYAALGSVSAVAGLALAGVAAGFVVRGLLGLPYEVDVASLAAVWVAVATLTVGSGLAASRGVLGRPPLPVLRDVD